MITNEFKMRMPGEFEPHDGCIMIWPTHPGSWIYDGREAKQTFSDIAELEACCKFSNCKHDTEPGCAVKAAIADGTLSMERFELFQNLHWESNKSAKMKAISKQRKLINKKRCL